MYVYILHSIPAATWSVLFWKKLLSWKWNCIYIIIIIIIIELTRKQHTNVAQISICKLT